MINDFHWFKVIKIYFYLGPKSKLFQLYLVGINEPEDLSILSNACAGFLASFFSSIAITPTELIKCKLQAMREVSKQSGGYAVGKTKYIGPVKLTQNIFYAEGITGLFRGLVPTLAREMPGYFFFFGGYEGAYFVNSLSSLESASNDIFLYLNTKVL